MFSFGEGSFYLVLVGSQPEGGRYKTASRFLGRDQS
jgi:hypothetical protein